MNRKLAGLFIATPMIAGFAGGVASRLWTPGPVFAQEQLHPAVLSAKSFTLVDNLGQRRGSLSLTRDGSVTLRLYDENGRERIDVGNASPAVSNRNSGRLFDIRILDPDGHVAWSAMGGTSLLPLGKEIR
jgi:hypothetical protein